MRYRKVNAPNGWAVVISNDATGVVIVFENGHVERGTSLCHVDEIVERVRLGDTQAQREGKDLLEKNPSRSGEVNPLNEQTTTTSVNKSLI